MTNRTLLLLLLVVISAMLVAGCSQPKPVTPAQAPATTLATVIATSTPYLTGCEQNAQDKAKEVMTTLPNLREVSFCEVIIWCTDPKFEVTGGTYGTSGLNDPKDSCPDALLKGIDKSALATRYKVDSVSTNPDTGRKFWIMDTFELPVSTTVRDYYGLKTRYWADTATGPNGEPQDLSAEGIPTIQYQPITMGRASFITFQKGKPVFLLDDPDGTTWIMKNYQTGVDPTLTYADLPTITTHFRQLPSGWKFRTKTLDQDLVLQAVNGTARIMWDELGDSWDALDPGVTTFIP